MCSKGVSSPIKDGRRSPLWFLQRHDRHLSELGSPLSALPGSFGVLCRDSRQSEVRRILRVRWDDLTYFILALSDPLAACPRRACNMLKAVDKSETPPAIYSCNEPLHRRLASQSHERDTDAEALGRFQQKYEITGVFHPADPGGECKCIVVIVHMSRQQYLFRKSRQLISDRVRRGPRARRTR